ncbi:MAG: TonB-dependent receptor [Haliea sp.]|nr:TonB-dependent receptor [Haliea sp.]
MHRDTQSRPTTSLHRLSLAIGLIAGSLVTQAQAQSVTGELVDSARNTVFQGAIVRIEELGVSVTTDTRGRFRLGSIPPGDYTLSISYVGAPLTRLPVSVSPEGTDLGEVVLGAGPDENNGGLARLEEVLVYGQSAAMAGAINQQRAANNIRSVLDADTMGQFPDQNVAESLRRLSGISVANDQGEGRYVVIRGMDPDLNATSINGVRATAAEDRRALQLDVIPTDVLDGLEVQKSLTPDMDGDAIGGSVNVKTLSAFSRKEAFLKTRIEGGYNELREEWSPKLSVAGSNTFELANGRRLGVAAALSWHDRKLLADNNEADDWTVADNSIDYAETFEPRYYQIDRQRIGAALNLDYDLSDSTQVYLRSLYSEFEDYEIRINQTYGDLEPISGESVRPGSADMAFAEIETGTKDREQTASNLSLSVGSESEWERWRLSTSLGYSRAEEEENDSFNSAWVGEFESGSDGIADGAPVLTFDTSNPRIPVIRSQYESLLRDPARYELDEVETGVFTNEDTQWSARFDVTRHFSNLDLKFGAKVRLREKTKDENAQIYGNDGDFTIADFLDPNLTRDYGFPTAVGPAPSLAAIRQLVRSGEGLELEALDSLIASNEADWTVEEDIYAAYGMLTWQADKLTAIAGMRVEYTDFNSRGNQLELFEEGDTFAGSVLEDDFVSIEGISSNNSYTDLLPSITLRYDMTDRVVARAAVSRSVVRPLFEAVAARVSVEDNEASIGNPELEPYSAWNADLSLEYYPSDISVISAGLFYKDIDDFIFTQTFDDFEFGGRVFDEAEIARNGDSASVQGLELNYQQQFGFLPSPFDGLLLSLNYTLVDSDASFGDRDIPLPKQSDTVGGFVLGYEKYGLDLRLAMSYRDEYLDEVVEAGYDRYEASHTQWDLTGKYHINDQWMVYGEIINLNDEPAHYYAGNSRRLLQYDEFGRTMVFGLQYVY